MSMSGLIDGIFERLLVRRVARQQEPAAPTDNRSEPRRPADGSALLEWIDEGDLEHAQAVHLVDESDEGTAICSPVPLEPGWPVLLTLPHGAPLKAVVRHRRRDSQGWVLGLRLIRRERRRFDRRPLDREIEVAWPGPDGRPKKALGRVQDVGEGGLRFACNEEIPVRTSVMLALEGWQRSGIIVHAREERRLVSYGVQFSGPPALQQHTDFDE